MQNQNHNSYYLSTALLKVNVPNSSVGNKLEKKQLNTLGKEVYHLFMEDVNYLFDGESSWMVKCENRWYMEWIQGLPGPEKTAIDQTQQEGTYHLRQFHHTQNFPPDIISMKWKLIIKQSPQSSKCHNLSIFIHFFIPI